jgi:predicted NBD/HSP70 family sugar kinase
MSIVLARGRFGSPASRVLSQVRWGGVVGREDLAKKTGLSASTVARTITTLVDAGLIRERPDLVPEGAVGRPSIPVEIDPDHYVVIGCHIGRRTTTISLTDLQGKTVSRIGVATPSNDPSGLVRRAARAATDQLARVSNRVALAAGLVAPWGDIAYDMDETGAALEALLGLPVETGDHIAAIAAAELAARPEALPGTTAYVYARDTLGFAIANDRPLGIEISRVGRLSHFPTSSKRACQCGRTGCLQAVVSDESVAQRAHDAGIVRSREIDLVIRAALRGNPAANDLLIERAAELGRIAAIVRDMVHPDRVVLCGQGFTAYHPGLQSTLDAFTASSTLSAVEVSFTRFGAGVQAVAAGNLALRHAYDDPTHVVGSYRGLRTVDPDRTAIS